MAKLKIALKMQEMAFQRPKFQTFSVDPTTSSVPYRA